MFIGVLFSYLSTVMVYPLKIWTTLKRVGIILPYINRSGLFPGSSPVTTKSSREMAKYAAFIAFLFALVFRMAMEWVQNGSPHHTVLFI